MTTGSSKHALGWYLQKDMQVFSYSILTCSCMAAIVLGCMLIIWSILASLLASIVGVYSAGYHYILTLEDFSNSGTISFTTMPSLNRVSTLSL